jgi:hypothetical protein
MQNLRPKDWVRFSVLVLLVVVVLVVELVSGGVREFYTERPLQAGVVTGVLLSVVAYFGLDAVRADLNERRWAPLSRLAFMWLASQTTLLIDIALWLVTAQRPVNDARPDDATQAELVNIRSAAKLDPPPLQVDLGQVQHAPYRQMLERLMVEPAWRRFAVKQLGRWKWRNRAGIGTWAAAMLSTGESADVLNRLALLNEWLSDVQDSLRSDSTFDREQAVANWLSWHAEAISVREDLVIAGRGELPPEWPAFRQALTPTDREELEGRHDPKRPDQARRILREPFKKSDQRSTSG